MFVAPNVIQAPIDKGLEIFMVLSGQAALAIGDGPERIAGPEVLSSAPR